ncbi:MAG: hypothetical protein QOH83_933, partial [Solirubrobacteraceae bacterium]|nr:hypothetical protein [Solirubrobacteraceae bacterium]
AQRGLARKAHHELRPGRLDRAPPAVDTRRGADGWRRPRRDVVAVATRGHQITVGARPAPLRRPVTDPAPRSAREQVYGTKATSSLAPHPTTAVASLPPRNAAKQPATTAPVRTCSGGVRFRDVLAATAQPTPYTNAHVSSRNRSTRPNTSGHQRRKRSEPTPPAQAEPRSSSASSHTTVPRHPRSPRPRSTSSCRDAGESRGRGSCPR